MVVVNGGIVLCLQNWGIVLLCSLLNRNKEGVGAYPGPRGG